ncbi:Uncharacterized protein TCM_036615 [Theobroma cacao]|uniref:Uncharacterized protein n=1 Tax=Theobroma cacao TaxID=3641 RepID=A0A061FL78_THECC|nr:Uncharacterized protein TCM_036615 [Theobroma cacao]
MTEAKKVLSRRRPEGTVCKKSKYDHPTTYSSPSEQQNQQALAHQKCPTKTGDIKQERSRMCPPQSEFNPLTLHQ